MDSKLEAGFSERVCELVRQIPVGRVMTYGQIAALCGNPRAGRIVGGVAHFGDPELPWQRVVNKSGGLAVGYPGGRAGHAEHLRHEGVVVSDDYKLNIAEILWQPGVGVSKKTSIRQRRTKHQTPSSRPPLVVIVGETASGKSALAMELAREFDGEIICADSRTVYKGMDVGTAKPSKQDQQTVRHHLLDIVGPDEKFTAAEFKRLANSAIKDISNRGKLPIMVGGTGLYVDGVIYDFGFEKIGDKKPLRPNTFLLGQPVDRELLKNRIVERTQKMIENDLEDEVRSLSDKFGWQAPAMTAIGYREFQPYFAGMQSLPETMELINRNTFLYAKRQRTWFKRNKSIQWLDDPNQAIDLVTTFLSTSV